MTAAYRTRSVVSAVLLVIASTTRTEAQAQSNTASPGTPIVSKVPGPQYQATAFQRTMFGSGWRDVWTTPVTAPVLDLETYGGGLKLDRRGGGFYSLVLHFSEKDGWREYRFRSVDKIPKESQNETLRGTLAGRIWQDQVSIMFPGAPLLVPPLHEAVGLLHTKPSLYVMGDSPRLEAQRDTFAGMLGTMELKGEEAPDDKPGFAGSEKIKGTEGFLEDINESREHRLDEREFLAARLVDFLINDVDRSQDNFDWARFGEKGAYVWRPLPRDRDQAFVDARGLLNTMIVNRVFPKQIPFGPVYDLKGLTYTSYTLDRRLLQRLDADDVRDVAHRVQGAVTNSVIDAMIAQMPSSWRAQTSADERIASALRTRRDALPEVAMTFYQQLASEVDVHGTKDADRFVVVRHPDGRVTVTITDPERTPMVAQGAAGSVVTTSGGTIGDRDAFYTRTFLPSETKELRLYAAEGDDAVVVSGAPSNAISVRVIGGDGNDVLADSAGGGATALYDAEGSNRLVTSGGTRVSTRPWKPVFQREGFRGGSDWSPDWGNSKGWAPAFDYTSDAGVIVGFGRRVRDYGFRRLPYHWEAGASFLVGTMNGRLGLNAYVDHRAENAPRGFRVEGLASQLEETRFYGYGNNTPEIDRDLGLVNQTMYMVEPSFVRYIGWRARERGGNLIEGDTSGTPRGLRPVVGELRIGGRFGWIDPQPDAGSPLATSGVAGSDEFGVAGGRIELELDRTDDDAVPTTGWTIDAEAAGYPSIGTDAFGTGHARGTFYIPLGRLGGPHVALRAGGSLATGDYPTQFAAAIGGRRSLRGYSWRRFAGDGAVNGGAELRVPVGTVNFIVRSKLGIFALADAGRVWFDGASEGAWHTGVGGGFWLSALGRSVSVAYAGGEGGKLYLSSGLFY